MNLFLLADQVIRKQPHRFDEYAAWIAANPVEFVWRLICVGFWIFIWIYVLRHGVRFEAMIMQNLHDYVRGHNAPRGQIVQEWRDLEKPYPMNALRGDGHSKCPDNW